MKHDRTFTISLCLNLALAGVAAGLLQRSVSPKMPAPAATVSDETASLAAASRSSASNSPASVTYVTNHFAWSQVEAEDFEQLAANLRAIGCPEKTVRDIVVARGRRVLERVSKEAEPKLPFWTAGLRRTRANETAEREARLAQEKIMARLERVVGPDVFLGDTVLMKTDELEMQGSCVL